MRLARVNHRGPPRQRLSVRGAVWANYDSLLRAVGQREQRAQSAVCTTGIHTLLLMVGAPQPLGPGLLKQHVIRMLMTPFPTGIRYRPNVNGVFTFLCSKNMSS